MKKHILVEHAKTANVAFDLEELHREKFNESFSVGYGAIIEHFRSANSYKKDDA
jgi:hypothetical protein